MTEYRLYTFTNMYLSDIQRGIQSAHLVHSLFTKYRTEAGFAPCEVLWEWAENHMTMIVLNGGYSSNLELIGEQCRNLGDELELPNSHFFESHDALNTALTCVGIVVPSEIYDAELDRHETSLIYDGECIAHDWEEEFELYKLIKGYPLA